MEWSVWEPFYNEIVQDLGYDRSADLRAAERLSELTRDRIVPGFDTIVEIIGERASIAGPAPSLEADIDRVLDRGTLVAVGSATGRLMEIGVVPDVIVTDLDGDVGMELEAIGKGALAFIHAHGDNIERIEEVVHRIDVPFVPTVQCRPFKNVYNFGGFTDGDRAFFMVKHFGAKEVRFLGWDLDRPFPKQGRDPSLKERKLRWARRLLQPHI